MVLLKMDPQFEGAVDGSASLFTDKHEVGATLSSVDLYTVTSFSHMKQ